MEEKIKINLLPAKFTLLQKEQKKFYRVQFISISLILSLIFFASTTVALRVLQSKNIQKAQSSLESIEDKVTVYKSKEASLVVLKSRLASIDQIISTPSKQREIFNLIDKIVPKSVVINSMSVDRSGNVSLSATVLSGSAIQEMLTNLAAKDKNEGRIAQVLLESLSRGRDGLYIIGLKIIAT